MVCHGLIRLCRFSPLPLPTVVCPPLGMLKEHCTTTMHPDPLAALVEALLPIVFAPTPLSPRRRRVIKLLRRQGSIAVVAGRLRMTDLPIARATASSSPASSVHFP